MNTSIGRRRDGAAGRVASARRSPRPIAVQANPTATAAIRLATNLAATISGWPGNATAVATSTTGLIAGAESKKVSAAAGVTPRDISRRAIGTEPHSQPGRAAPASAATGTAYTGRSGNTRESVAGETNAAITALTVTPRTRKGSAWTATATKTVAQLATAGR